MRHNINQSHKSFIYGHSGSSSILLILMYVVVPEKLPGQKRCDEEAEEEHEFLGVFDVFLK